MGFDIIEREYISTGEAAQPPRALSFGARFGSVHQIAFADDANKLPW
jgi:hypothetical protein